MHVGTLLSLLLVLLRHVVYADIDISTEYGQVRGHTVPVVLETGDFNVISFLGIPYARPPVGELRFQPPQKAVPWEDILVADELPNLCTQHPSSFLQSTHPLWTRFDEDCLYLNIFTPEDISIPHPVMVWIHGGRYTVGGSIQYPGHFLAARGVVVVTINYRLGVFGFANTLDGSMPGNMGLYDQLMALEFVRDNIAAFGGRPNQVTIFGQSAGAGSVSLQMLSPKSKSRGLYQQAIAQSGADTNFWIINPSLSHPENYLLQVAGKLDCPTDEIPEMVSCLRDVSASDLLAADEFDCATGYTCLGFAPVVDGPGGFIPDLPRLLREELKEDSIPILSGICKEDGFILDYAPEAAQGGFTRADFEYYLHERFLFPFVEVLTAEQYEAAYNALDFQYSPWPYLDDLEANRHAFLKFGFQWDRQAKLNAQYKDTYTYIQVFRSQNYSVPEWMGVPHNGDLPFVWGYPYLLINPAVREDSGIFVDSSGWTAEDMNYTDYVQTLWSNFAKFGNPTPSPIKAPFNDTLTTWPKYSMEDNLKVLYLDTEISVAENYKQQQYSFFTHYAPTIVNRPLKTKK